MAASSGTLVLGIGNLLMGDEGVGVHALDAFARESWPDRVTLLDGGTGGFHLLEYLRTFDPIILVDATMDGQPAGTVSVLRPHYASDFPRSLTAHDIGLRDLVESAVLLGPLATVLLVTVSITDVRSMTTTLSPDVAASLPRVGAVVRRLLAEEAAPAHA